MVGPGSCPAAWYGSGLDERYWRNCGISGAGPVIT